MPNKILSCELNAVLILYFGGNRGLKYSMGANFVIWYDAYHFEKWIVYADRQLDYYSDNLYKINWIFMRPDSSISVQVCIRGDKVRLK